MSSTPDRTPPTRSPTAGLRSLDSRDVQIRFSKLKAEIDTAKVFADVGDTHCFVIQLHKALHLLSTLINDLDTTRPT